MNKLKNISFTKGKLQATKITNKWQFLIFLMHALLVNYFLLESKNILLKLNLCETLHLIPANSLKHFAKSEKQEKVFRNEYKYIYKYINI